MFYIKATYFGYIVLIECWLLDLVNHVYIQWMLIEQIWLATQWSIDVDWTNLVGYTMPNIYWLDHAGWLRNVQIICMMMLFLDQLQLRSLYFCTRRHTARSNLKLLTRCPYLSFYHRLIHGCCHGFALHFPSKFTNAITHRKHIRKFATSVFILVG